MQIYRGETRSAKCWFTPSMATTARIGPSQNQEPGTPYGFLMVWRPSTALLLLPDD